MHKELLENVAVALFGYIEITVCDLPGEGFMLEMTLKVKKIPLKG